VLVPTILCCRSQSFDCCFSFSLLTLSPFFLIPGAVSDHSLELSSVYVPARVNNTPDIALARDVGKLAAEASVGHDNLSCRSQSSIVVSLFISCLPLSFDSFGFLARLVLTVSNFRASTSL
jgi:hypothetical protein